MAEPLDPLRHKKLAEEILSLYADLDRLTPDECQDLKDVSEQQCQRLREALGPGDEGMVTKGERQRLADAGLASTLLQELVGTDGAKALKRRVEWLAEKATRRGWQFWKWNTSERTLMVQELGEVGPKAIELSPTILKTLAEAVESDDRYLRRAGIEALGQMGARSEQSIPTLLELARSDDYPDSELPILIKALGRIRKRPDLVVPFLIENSFSDRPWPVRLAAIEALGEFGREAKQAIPTLTIGLRDPILWIRQYTIRSLGRIVTDEKGTIGTLVSLLADPNPLLRDTAEAALVRIGAPTVETLRKAIARQEAKTLPEILVVHVCRVVARLGPQAEAATEELIPLLADTRESVVQAALSALGAIGEKATGPLVAALEAEEPRIKVHVGRVFGRMPNLSEEVLHALGSRFTDPAQEVREAALETFVAIAPQGLETLVVFSSHPVPEVRWYAVRAIGGLAPKIADQAAPLLVQALGDEEISVRGAAFEALAALVEKVQEALIKGLGARSVSIIEAVLHLLGRLGPRALPAAPQVIQVLASESVDVRVAAQETLVAFGPGSLPPLTEELKRSGRTTHQTLGILKVVAAIAEKMPGRTDPLDQMLVTVIPLLGEGREVGPSASDTLVGVGPKGLLVLLPVLTDRSQKRSIRSPLLDVVGKIGKGDADATEAMVALLHDPEFSARAAQYLVEWDRDAAPRLVVALRDPHTEVRRQARRVLLKMRSSAVEALVGSLPDPDLGPLAANLLGELGRTAAPQLIRSLASPNPVVAKQVEEILVRMESEAVADLTEALEEEREAIRTAAARVLARIRDTDEGDER